MQAFIVSSKEEVVARLSADPGVRWIVLDGEVFSPVLLDDIERAHPGRSLDTFLKEASSDLKVSIRELFSAAVSRDKEGLFPLSAGVPLSIKGWRDIEMLLGAALFLRGGGKLVLLVAADSPAFRLAQMLLGKSSSYPSVAPFLARLLRTALRLVLRRKLCLTPGVDLWVSVGGYLESGQSDTYFARWPWQAGRPFLRLYLQGGGAIKQRSNDEQAPLEAMLCWSDLWAASLSVWEAIRHERRGGDESLIGRLLGYLWREEIVSGEVFTLAVQRRAWRNLIDGFRPICVIVPFEARAWERSLLRQARQSGIKTVGYQHSSITPRHLALLGGGLAGGDEWIPDNIVCCGEVTARRLVTANPGLQARIHAGAALRSTNPEPSPLGCAVLVALSSSRQEALAMFRIFASACQLGLSCPLIFRAHPTIPVDDLFNQFEWPAFVSYSQNRSLDDDLNSSWCVAYSSATVVLEGMRRGRVPLFIDIGDILSGNPLDEELPFLLVASDPRLLLHQLTVLEMGSEKCAEMGSAAREYAQRYLVSPTPELVAEMTIWAEKS